MSTGRITRVSNWSAGISGSAVLCVEAVAAIAADGGVVSTARITALNVIRVVDAGKPGSIFDDDVAPGFAKLLSEQLGSIPIKRAAIEIKSL